MAVEDLLIPVVAVRVLDASNSAIPGLKAGRIEVGSAAETRR